MQRDADGLVFVDWKNPDEGVLTGKLFEYLAASAPLLVVGSPAGSPIVEIMEQARAGVPCAGNVDAMCDAVLSIVRHEADGERDRKFIGTFTRERQSLALLDRIREDFTTETQSAQR
jgi:glycosyltransferase involved in cell wall biosynthesis